MFDPRHPTLKPRLAGSGCLGAVWLALGSAAITELAARARPDALVLDQQHGLWERRELEAAIGLVPREIPVLVRVAENSALAIGTALDAGAEGVIVPLIESAEEAAQALRYARYPPLGLRSGGGVRPLQDFAGYVAGANAIATILMIETRAGLAQSGAIAGTEGVDMVFIGTGDLALSLGVAPTHAGHVEACAAILRASEAAGVPCGIFTGSAEAARIRRDEGYRMVVVATDIDLALRGFAAATAGFRDPQDEAGTR
ncbi:MAG: aldolase [Betaproteobacteria bacterium]|nr:aldolase [Betaproteobacteria bacterium]